MSSCASPGAKSTWHMGQLCKVIAPSTDDCRWEGCSSEGCSSALGVPRSSGAAYCWGDPVRPRTALSTRSEPPEFPPRPGEGAGKGVQKKVSVPTVNVSGGGRSGLRLGSWSGNAGSGGSSPSTFRSALAVRSNSVHSFAHSPPSGRDPAVLLRGLGRRGWA